MVAFGLYFLDRLVVLAAPKRAKRARTKPTSDSHEREKIASAWQQRLHGALIGSSFVNLMARRLESQDGC
jgi:hypothetical protein